MTARVDANNSFFFAALASGNTSQTCGRVKFPSIQINNGSGFNTNGSFFVAPERENYAFSFDAEQPSQKSVLKQ